MRDLQSNEIKLAALVAPAGLDPALAAAINLSIDQAFVFAFRLVMLLCAALAIISAAFAWRMIAVGPAPGASPSA